MTDFTNDSDDSTDDERLPVVANDVDVGSVDGFVARSEPINHIDADADVLVDEIGSERRSFHLPWREEAFISIDTDSVVDATERR